MKLDGFDAREEEAFVGYSAATAARFYAFAGWLSGLLHVEVEGIERLPAGRAVVVANHAFGFDVALPMAAVHAATGRTVWALGEHAWWRFPFLRRLAARVGVVDGTQDNADRLLAADQLVLVLPGGLREAMKPRELRYRLLWGRRFGFVRAAIRNGAPLVPLAAIGSDEEFELVGDAFARGRRWTGIRGLPIPRPSLAPLLHPARLRYVFGEPIPARARPEDAADAQVVRRVRREVEGELQELIDVELARRAGIPLEDA